MPLPAQIFKSALKPGDHHVSRVQSARVATQHRLDGFGPVQQKALRKIDADLVHPVQHLDPVHKPGHRLDADHPGQVNEAAHGRVVEQAMPVGVQRLDALGIARKAVFVQGLLQPGRPRHFAVAGAHGLVGVEPGMHPVAPGLLGGITRRVGRQDQRCRAAPAVVHRHQADAGADPEAPFIVHEPEVVHAVAGLLGHTLGLQCVGREHAQR